MAELRAVVLRTAQDGALPWERAIGDSIAATVDPRSPLEALQGAMQDASCVLVDGGVADAADRIRRAHRADPAVQAVIVASALEQPRLSRSILFTPGIGEVWFLSPEELDRGLVERAGRVTRTRRRYRETHRRIVQDLAAVEGRKDPRTVVSDAYLAALLEAVPHPVLSVDDAGHVLTWNPGTGRVLGYSRAEAVGQPLGELLGNPSAVLPLMRGDPTAGAPFRREIRFRRKNGEEGVGELIVAPVEAGGQRVKAIILHDLTEERNAQEEIQAQAAELEAQAEELQAQAAELEMINDELQSRTVALEHAARARDRFYAAMSHELRTPINAILGFLDLVLTGVYGPIGGKQEEGLVRAQRAARHLHELVNDVLDLARIEAGRMEIQPETTWLPQVIEEVVDTVRALADQKGSALEVRGEGTHCIRTDSRRLRQILLNLLSNAIKFGLGNPIEVRWEATEKGGARIQVVDRGTGIAEKDLQLIFDEFSQIASTPDSGTGLGLPISLRLAQLLGGSLEAVSDPGQGSTFTLTLPDELPDGRAGTTEANA